MTKLHVVTAMVDPGRTKDLWRTWRENGKGDWNAAVMLNGVSVEALPAEQLMAVHNLCVPGGEGEVVPPGYGLSPEILGTVPAFYHATEAFECAGDDIIALFHDDLAIHKQDWDLEVLEFFRTHPGAGMVGFGGAYGVGRAGMYNCPEHGGAPCKEGDAGHADGMRCLADMNAMSICDRSVVFDPMTLARHHFMSGMRDAEAHGERVHTARPVAVLDGFSLIGRAWLVRRALQRLMDRKVVHHAYDVAFGCETRRAGLQTWLLPLSCHHAGGQTAVGSAAYQDWAKAKHGGDGEVWKHAHRQVWEEYRDVLPFDVRQG